MNTVRENYIESLIKAAESKRRLFSNKCKAERERMVTRAFLRGIGVGFSEEDLISNPEEPVDVSFKEARFQVMEILDERRRGQEIETEIARFRDAGSVSELIEPWHAPEAIPYPEVIQKIADRLNEKKAEKYGYATCSTVDVLVYFNLKNRYLFPDNSSGAEEGLLKLEQQGWRSVSAVLVPYGFVIAARDDCPELLSSKVGQISREWKIPFGLFDAQVS